MKPRLLAALLLLLLPISAQAQTGTTYIDRLFGLTTASAIKAPVRCATTGPITLSGAQTIDGVAVTDHLNDSTGLPPDRVLVKNQSDQTTNGVYSVSSTGAWMLAGDWQGAYNAVSGTLVIVNAGSTQSGLWQLTTLDPVVIAPALGNGSNITFARYTLTIGTATNATNIGTTPTSTNALYYITGVASAGGGNQAEATNPSISFNPSTGTVSATNFSGVGANLTGNATIQNLTVNGTCTGCSGSASLSLSGLIAATTTNSINNGGFAQAWAWQSLGSGNALTLSTTNATSGGLLVLSELTTGAGAALSSTLTGASNTGYAGYFANPSTTGYAVYAAGAAKVTGALSGAAAAFTGTLTGVAANFSGALTDSTTATFNNVVVSGNCTGCGSGAMILLNTVNASGAAQVVFNSTYITSAYNKYVIEFDSLFSSASDEFGLVVSTNNGGSYSNTGYSDWNTAITGSSFTSGGGTSIALGGLDVAAANAGGAQGTIKFSKPSGGQFTFFENRLTGRYSSGTPNDQIGGGMWGAGAVNNIKLFALGSSTLTGNFHLYALSGS